MNRLKLWRKRRQVIRKLKAEEADLQAHGPYHEWVLIAAQNRRLGIWDGTFRLPEERR